MSVIALALLGQIVMQEPAPGLSFGEGIPSHEQVSLLATFEDVLPRACEPPPCTEDCPDDAPTIALLISGNTRDYTLHWEVTAPQLDAPLIVDSRCDLCSLAEFEDQFASDLHALCGRLDALETAPGRLQISSAPADARLRIDGRRPGRHHRTPWVGELPSGEHRIEVYAPGYHRQERTVQIVSRVNEHQHFELLPAAKRRSTAPGWATMSLGLVMGVAGSVLIALDNKPWMGRCSERNIDAYGNCKFVYDTLPLGIGLATAGGIATATGVGLVVWAQRGEPGQSEGGFALRGRF
ncbi:PEGA domain-containing protein [Enhygromyxa salina]|uniref:PEGA domain protein n=1 Tax=Enhygromyxa salina TaxID=215803 RepID=A0A2S9XN20_9BACT|nr:PEGA domain-containing protein [Enhygromyxa salina]PRP94267.1 PEGA domain protein [Enhygromyxa salina]